MKIYVPTKAIIDSLFIAQDKEDGKLYLAFYIKSKGYTPFIFNWLTFVSNAIDDSDVENYKFYPFTVELFHRLLAYLKDAKGTEKETYEEYCSSSFKLAESTREHFREYQVGCDLMTGIKSFLKYFSDPIIRIKYETSSYKNLGYNQTTYQKAFWFAIAPTYDDGFTQYNLRDFLIGFLFDLSDNPNVTEFVYEIDEIQRPCLLNINPILRRDFLGRLKHYAFYLSFLWPLTILVIAIIKDL